ncbi:MAG: N-acetyltransferase [Verrucomicrobiales bacterium]|nr:N-acetyltransferase [Verrucomicrobiales bacterium]
MKLELKTCVIRPFNEADAESVQHYADNRKVWMCLRDFFPHPYSLEDAKAFIKLVSQENPLKTFAIATPTEAIGSIGLRPGVDVHRKSAELGYWLAEPFWGRGIMSEAVTAFVATAFDRFDLIRIYAELFANNRASARVLEKAGFAFEGRLRANVIKNEEILDSLMFGRIRNEVVLDEVDRLK